MKQRRRHQFGPASHLEEDTWLIQQEMGINEPGHLSERHAALGGCLVKTGEENPPLKRP